MYNETLTKKEKYYLTSFQKLPIFTDDLKSTNQKN